MPSVELLHTYQLSPAELEAIQQLLLDSFSSGVTGADFVNALGGMHAMVRDERGALTAHASVVPRRMLHQGRSIRTGYVEAVAVSADHRRQGLGGAVMDAIESVICGAYELGALSASADGALLYADRRWQPWRGTTSVLSPEGILRTPEDDDAVQVLAVDRSFAGTVPPALNYQADLACDWRDGDVW